MSDQIDEAQMAADFASLPDPVNAPFQRAREIVDTHVAKYGMTRPDELKSEIGIALVIAEIKGIDRGRDRIEALEAEVRRYAAEAVLANTRVEALEAALRKIAQDKGMQGYRIVPTFDAEEMMKLARAALAPEQDTGIGCGKSVIEPWSTPEREK